MEEVPNAYNQKTIAHFQPILVRQRVDLIAHREQQEQLFNQELEDTEPMDRAQVIQKHDATANGDKDRLHEIEGALQRCKDGTYGICLDCHRPIPWERLDASPAGSPYCCDCLPKHKLNSKVANTNLSPAFNANPLGIFAVRTGRRKAT